MSRISRADIRGRKLNKLCYKANTTNEGGMIYCYGLTDKRDDEYLAMCTRCEANINLIDWFGAVHFKGGGEND